MAQEEQVLVVERKVIEDLGMFHGLQFDVEPYLEKIFTPGIMSFMPRSKAEVNPDYKQLIPYVVMTYNGKFLNYIRGKRAGEKRLVGNRSMGIGGHVNPIDANGGCQSDSRKMYFSAVEREIEEEVNVQTGYTDQIVALLNDDTNEVGQVHLGVVHYWQLESEDVTRREQMITQMNFMTPQELQDVRESLETWSQLCLDGVADFKS
jgi:predicted NUDIX family phosphoesterase